MRIRSVFSTILIMFLAAGCSSMWGVDSQTRSGVSSSLVDYLYPGGEVPPDIQDTIPHLNLPLRVGIAFVPGHGGALAISETTKIELLEKVKGEFTDRDFIERIEVIPDTYLRSSYGIDGMQQVARLYGVDVMALVSYDQVAVSEDNPESFLYWTIVGSYLIKGTSNEVQTFVDTAVFDTQTARLLFRAPGLDRMSDRSTLVESHEVIRKAKDASFSSAMTAMTANLTTELDNFRERAKDDPTLVSTQWKEGYGGGALGLWFLLGATALLACRSRRARRAATLRPDPGHRQRRG